MSFSLEPNSSLPAIRILPINSAAQLKGSIHDDEKAREMGYAGGLVPGSTVLSYMSRLMHETFGTGWMEGASFSGRLRRPVYEGVEVTIEGNVVDLPANPQDGRVTVELRVVAPDGTVAALAQASCCIAAKE